MCQRKSTSLRGGSLQRVAIHAGVWRRPDGSGDVNIVEEGGGGGECLASRGLQSVLMESVFAVVERWGNLWAVVTAKRHCPLQ